MFKKETWRFIRLILIIFLIAMAVSNISYFYDILQKLMSIISPLFWGIGIAYILNPFMVRLHAKYPAMPRALAIFIVYLVFLLVLTIFVRFALPTIARSVSDIIQILPRYIDLAYTFLTEKTRQFVDFSGINEELFHFDTESINNIKNFANQTLNSLVLTAVILAKGLATFILGIVISIYLLLEKERFLKNAKRYFIAFLGKEKAQPFFDYMIKVNQVFKNFLVGKMIDSVIIGIIAFVGLTLLKVDYSALLAIIIGVTNMIPYFGPFIGAVPTVGITLFFDPIKALWVALFILLLQQFDGIYLGPKILGGRVGVSPIFIIITILIGGGFGGPLGMLLAVPVFKSLVVLWDNLIDKKLKETKEKKKPNNLKSININVDIDRGD